MLRRNLNTLGTGSTPVRISIDYFSLRKRAQHHTPTESPTWAKSTSTANLSPASQSLSSSGNSKHSWQSYINSRFRLGSMPDLQVAVNAASKMDGSNNSRTGNAGMRLVNALVSGGRLGNQSPQAAAPALSDTARRRQSTMSTTTLESTSGRATSDVSSSRLSVHFNHTPHRRPSTIARPPITKPLYSSKAVAVGYRPTEHDEEDLSVFMFHHLTIKAAMLSYPCRPTMIPFVEPELIPQYHAHISAYADLLAQWNLHYKSTEVRKSIPNLQKSKANPQTISRDAGRILSVERLCIQCASTSDGQRPFGTCGHNHNWSSSMKCTVCRLPTRGE